MKLLLRVRKHGHLCPDTICTHLHLWFCSTAGAASSILPQPLPRLQQPRYGSLTTFIAAPYLLKSAKFDPSPTDFSESLVKCRGIFSSFEKISICAEVGYSNTCGWVGAPGVAALHLPGQTKAHRPKSRDRPALECKGGRCHGGCLCPCCLPQLRWATAPAAVWGPPCWNLGDLCHKLLLKWERILNNLPETPHAAELGENLSLSSRSPQPKLPPHP